LKIISTQRRSWNIFWKQKEALGLGHAVLAARELVGNEPFAVLLGDVIISGAPVTKTLIEIYEETGKGAIALEAVPRENVHLYGIADTQPAPGQRWGESVKAIHNLVEKPSPEEAPSNLSVTGRYVLPPSIFNYLAATKPGRGGEIQLTDALQQLAEEEGLYGYVFTGKSYDAGDKLGFLKATVELGLENAEFGEAFRTYLRALKLQMSKA